MCYGNVRGREGTIGACDGMSTCFVLCEGVRVLWELVRVCTVGV